MNCRPNRNYPPSYRRPNRQEDNADTHKHRPSKKMQSVMASVLATAALTGGGYLSPDINWEDDVDEIARDIH